MTTFTDPLRALMLHNDADGYSALLNRIENVNATDFFGTTALVHAVKADRLWAVRLLLQHPDIDVDFVEPVLDRACWSPLAHAVQNHCLGRLFGRKSATSDAIVFLLVEQGADWLSVAECYTQQIAPIQCVIVERDRSRLVEMLLGLVALDWPVLICTIIAQFLLMGASTSKGVVYGLTLLQKWQMCKAAKDFFRFEQQQQQR